MDACRHDWHAGGVVVAGVLVLPCLGTGFLKRQGRGRIFLMLMEDNGTKRNEDAWIAIGQNEDWREELYGSGEKVRWFLHQHWDRRTIAKHHRGQHYY